MIQNAVVSKVRNMYSLSRLPTRSPLIAWAKNVEHDDSETVV